MLIIFFYLVFVTFEIIEERKSEKKIQVSLISANYSHIYSEISFENDCAKEKQSTSLLE